MKRLRRFFLVCLFLGMLNSLSAQENTPYTYQGQENYRFPSRSSNMKFDVNVDGFIEVKASGRSYSPSDINSPVRQTILNDPVYKKIPRDVLLGPIDIDTRTRVSVEGNLSNDLYVSFDIEQEPEMPGKFDVGVRYKDHEMQFYHLTADYKQGDFISIQKPLKGAQYKYTSDATAFQVSMGKERSDSRVMENFGSGSKTLKLSHRFVFPGSVRVYVNNKRKSEGGDYTVDYYAGIVTFSNPPQKSDYYKIIYESSNPIADYLPVLARRSFQAIQYSRTAQSKELYELASSPHEESFIAQTKPSVPFSPTLNIQELDLAPTASFILTEQALLLPSLELHPSYVPTLSITEKLQNTSLQDKASIIQDALETLYLQTSNYKNNFNARYSNVQLFPDSLASIDSLSLRDSLGIFNTLILMGHINQQGYLRNSIPELDTIFGPTSPFYIYDTTILNWLKLYFFEKKQNRSPRYILAHRSIVLGSEVVHVNATKLTANQDYVIDYTLGTLSLLLPVTSSDTLSISYRYFHQFSFTEDLIGKSRTGPYKLSYFPVVDGSLNLSLNGYPMVEINDYILDYDTGELFFNFEVPYPDLISAQYNYIEQRVRSEKGKQQPFDISATYMSEYVPADKETQVLAITSENTTVSSNIVQLANWPLTQTDDLKVTVENTAYTASDYILHPVKGQIEFTNPAVNSADKATVSYSYLKGHTTKFTLPPDALVAGSRHIDFQNIVLRDSPIKYKGVSHISIMNGLQEIKLEEPDSYIISWNDEGTSIQSIELLTRQDNSASILDHYPGPGSRVTLHYEFTPNAAANSSDVRHSMFGTTLKAHVNDRWILDGELAVAKNNFSSLTFDGSATNMKGSGVDGHYYNLGQTNIVEHSEQVFLSSISQTRDEDYFINYKNGTLRFRNKTPGPQDTIDVMFKYQKSGGKIQAGKTETSYATKMSAQYTIPSFNILTSFKYIDRNFTPLGSIKETKGSTILDSSFDWKIAPDLSLSSSYYRKKSFSETTQERNRDLYVNSDALQTNLKNTLFNVIDMTHGFRYQYDIKDANDTNTHDIDKLVYSYNGNYAFGPKYFRTSTSYGTSKEQSDYKDKLLPKTTQSKTGSITSDIAVDKLFLLKAFTAKPEYYYSLAETTETVSPTRSYTRIQKFDISSSSKLFSSLTLSSSAGFSQTDKKTSIVSAETSNSAYNYQASTTYNPFSWISTTASYSHSESESALIDQKSDRTRVKSAAIQRLIPYTGIRKLGFSKHHYLSTMFNNSNISVSFSETDKQLNNRRNNQYSNMLRYGMTKLTLLPTLSLHNGSYSISKVDNLNQVSSRTSSENATLSETQKRAFDLSFTPTLGPLDALDYKASFQDSLHNSLNTYRARSVTGNESAQENIDQTLSHEIIFSPPQFILKTPFNRIKPIRIGSLRLTAKQTYYQKNYTSNKYDLIYVVDESRFSRETKLSSFIDNETKETSTVRGSLSPLNLLTLTGGYLFEHTYLNRNKDISSERSTFQEKQDFDISTSISPFAFLSFSVSGSQKRYSQWAISSVNITASSLKSTAASEYIKNLNQSGQASMTFKPLRFFSLTGAYSLSEINETTGIVSSSTLNTFRSNSQSATIGFYPLKSLSITGTYSFDTTFDRDGSKTTGTSNNQTLIYTPISTTYSKISINYTRHQAGGSGFNTLSQSTSRQATGDYQATEVVTRDNVIQTGSISISIDYPINNVYVQKFSIVAEGHLKDVSDEVKANNTYSISGMVLKGTLSL